MAKELWVALLTALALGSCTPEAEEPKGRELELATKSVDFALKFHGELLKRHSRENVFLSPVSAFLALSMIASGAEGTTRDELFAALELKGWGRDDVDRGCRTLLEWLKSADPKVQLEVANSLWTDKAYPVHDAYVDRLDHFYEAQAASLDFRDPGSADRINTWARDRTHGKITGVVSPEVVAQSVLLILNAVYFKGSWEHEFKKSDTRDQEFTLEDGKKKKLPFMRREGTYALLDTPDYEAIRIPYGEKQHLAMIIVLPKGRTTMTNLLDLLGTQWNGMKAGFVEDHCELQLPRFRLDCEFGLNDILNGMGVKTAFSDSADFSGVSPLGKTLRLSGVLQKTFIDVNEEGTEAAAVTVVKSAAVAVRRTRIFRADHPFFCAIVDKTTGTLLFSGSIVEPK